MLGRLGNERQVKEVENLDDYDYDDCGDYDDDCDDEDRKMMMTANSRKEFLS